MGNCKYCLTTSASCIYTATGGICLTRRALQHYNGSRNHKQRTKTKIITSVRLLLQHGGSSSHLERETRNHQLTIGDGRQQQRSLHGDEGRNCLTEWGRLGNREESWKEKDHCKDTDRRLCDLSS